MTRQGQWAIIGGLALLIVGFVVLQIYLYVDMENFKKELEVGRIKTETETPKTPEVEQTNIDNGQTPIDQPKRVQHGDHSHEVLVAEWDLAIPVAPVPSIPGLTYHADLLETNPVEALRLLAEELGHWSKDHIPPFPPEDLEAQAFARNIYLSIYLDESHPDRDKFGQAHLEQLRAINEKYPRGARRSDLKRLIWIGTTKSGEGILQSLPWRPSDYFKYENPHLEEVIKQVERGEAYKWKLK